MGKKKEKIKVAFVGNNAIDVTGSQTYIEMTNYKILLECGLVQGGTVLEDYRANTKKFEFKPNKLDYVFINHSHIDHIGNLGRLIKEGFNGRIICPKGNKQIIYELCKDCSHIMFKDVEYLKKKFPGKQFVQAYTEKEVEMLMDYIDEYDFNEKIKLNDSIEFCFSYSQHIINSAQLELWLTQNSHTKKILYTSDLGKVSVDNYYVKKINRIKSANLVIAESTYSDEKKKQITKKDREKDIEKIKSIVEQIEENKGNVLFPCFSLHRIQTMITFMYDLFSNEENLKCKFVLASPLANKICNIFLDILEGEELEKFKSVMEWDKLIRITEFEQLQRLMEDNENYIYLASAGFLNAGYSRAICAKLLGSGKNFIVVNGYTPEGSLAYKIKSSKQKYITIDDKVCRNLANCIALKSMSSHMQYNDLLKYYSDINCDQIVLVHGDMKTKIQFAKKLQDEIGKKNKTQKVVICNKNTTINL